MESISVELADVLAVHDRVLALHRHRLLVDEEHKSDLEGDDEDDDKECDDASDNLDGFGPVLVLPEDIRGLRRWLEEQRHPMPVVVRRRHTPFSGLLEVDSSLVPFFILKGNVGSSWYRNILIFLNVRLNFFIQLPHLLVLSFDDGSASGGTLLEEVSVLKSKHHLCYLHFPHI